MDGPVFSLAHIISPLKIVRSQDHTPGTARGLTHDAVSVQVRNEIFKMVWHGVRAHDLELAV